MDKKIGFIGAGKMASAIITGILDGALNESSNKVSRQNIFASEINPEFARQMSKNLGIKVFTDNVELIKNVDVIILCIKPFAAKEVLAQIAPYLNEKHLVISIMAGISTKTIENVLMSKIPVIRVMPNTPALVKEAISAVCPGSFASSEDIDFTAELFKCTGQVIIEDEKNIDIITALSGSSPAFYCYFIEEMARAGEKLGLNYQTALKLCAQSALGTAKMILETQMPPEKLIENVSTKGGCTEVGNNVLKENHVSDILFNMIEKTALKAKELGD